jgi:hypothetical protein
MPGGVHVAHVRAFQHARRRGCALLAWLALFAIGFTLQAIGLQARGRAAQ